MPDVYSVITELDDAVVERVAAAMETSAADPQHRAMVLQYLAQLDLTATDYMISIVDRGADTLAGDGLIGAELAAALKSEARRRVDDATFFGHVAYGSLVAHRPAAHR